VNRDFSETGSAHLEILIGVEAAPGPMVGTARMLLITGANNGLPIAHRLVNGGARVESDDSLRLRFRR